MSTLVDAEDAFRTQLTDLIAQWEAAGVRSVSIKFQSPKLHLMNVTSAFGFKFHHALGPYCMMVLWMDKTCESRIP